MVVVLSRLIRQRILNIKELLQIKREKIKPSSKEKWRRKMATNSSILAWRSPWTEEPGKPQSMGHKELDTTEQLTLSLVC